MIDAYDAMITDRPYRQARSSEAAVEEIARSSGTHFDPEVVEAFPWCTRTAFRGSTTTTPRRRPPAST